MSLGSIVARSSRRLFEAAPPWLQQQIRCRHHLWQLRRHRVPEEHVFAALVTPGTIVMDLGAHVGWFVETLARLVGPQGRVIAVEPVPSTHEILAYGIARRRLTNVTAVQCAIADREGEAVMEIPRYGKGWPDAAGVENYYGARFATPSGTKRGLRQFTVPIRTVDSLADGPVSLIKMDVEGQELAALRGARGVISAWRPALMVELPHDPRRHPESAEAAVLRLLADEGYHPWWWDGEHLQTPEDRPEKHYVSDYFFLTPSQQESVRARGLGPAST